MGKSYPRAAQKLKEIFEYPNVQGKMESMGFEYPDILLKSRHRNQKQNHEKWNLQDRQRSAMNALFLFSHHFLLLQLGSNLMASFAFR